MDRWLRSAYRPELGDTTGTVEGRPSMGDGQAFTIVFIILMTGLLLALEVGMRRAQRPR